MTATQIENEVLNSLNHSRESLGDGVPRLLTRKPQVASSGLIHGLTGQFTYLTDLQLVVYLSAGAKYFQEMRPVGIRETQLLQRIIDTNWRLSRIAHLAETLELASVTVNARNLSKAHPAETEETLEPYAYADGFRNDGNHYEKLSRYETRLNRLSESMNREYDRIQSRRLAGKDAAQFNEQECDGLQWYAELLPVASRLVEARRELTGKSKVVAGATTPESGTSGAKMVGKNRLHILTPLTEKTQETLETSNEWGLLSEMERTLFPKMMAA